MTTGRIEQNVNGKGNTFTSTGDVSVTHHHYPPGAALPPPPLSGKFQLAKLPRTDARLFGREEELNLLDQAWQEEKTRVLVLTAFGGMGKTALMQAWLDAKGYAGADAVYTWSFYSQGTAEDRQASAAEFFDSALRWFGHDGSPLPSEHDRGLKLAELVCRQRTLLILDGLEPLQYPLGGAMDGALRDKGILCLCRQLTAEHNGLLLISSRQSVQELADRPGVEQHELEPLSEAAGLALFRAAGIRGEDDELVATVKNYDGHALSLNLLATYLTEYESGDIIQQYKLHNLVEFPEETYLARHAFKVMAAYERQLTDSADVQLLYSLGLFDRPVSAGAMACLRDAEIPYLGGMTLCEYAGQILRKLLGRESRVTMIDDKVFHAACKRLRRLGLLNKEDTEHPGTLDCHPLVRQYFGKRLEELHPASWRKAHARLYEYFKALPKKELPDTLEEMEPLFAAVRHGCAAGLHRNVIEEVYWPRIHRKNNNYLCNNFGEYAADLATITCFFSTPWCVLQPELTDSQKALLLNLAGYRLRALGRLQEAIAPMQAGLEIRIQQKIWENAALAAFNLSELYLKVGAVSKAIAVAQQSMNLADRSGQEDMKSQEYSRVTLAVALHQAGKWDKAHSLFITAERVMRKRQPKKNYLYSFNGFQYCDLLLTKGAWPRVQVRAEQTIQRAEKNQWLSDIALDKLSLGRTALQEVVGQAGPLAISGLAQDSSRISLPNGTATQDSSIVKIMHYVKDWLERAVAGLRKAIAQADLPAASGLAPDLSCVSLLRNTTVEPNSLIAEIMLQAKNWLEQAVAGLRKAGQDDDLPHGLLARAAWSRWAIVLLSHTDSIPQAVQDLQETEEIAQRGGMRLYLIDFHLEATRLALTAGQDILNRTATEHLAAAKKGIEETGYKRRLPEVANIEEQMFGAETSLN